MGVGIASRSNKSSDFQINKSQQDALRDLSENIQVTIRSELTIKQSSDNATSFTNEEAQSLIVSSSNASLKDVTTDAVWLDHSNCLVWTRVKIRRSFVAVEMNRQRQKTQLGRLQNLLESIDPDLADIDEVQNDLELATTMFANIDYSLLDDAVIQIELELRIKQLRQAVEQSSASTATAESLFLAAREALQRAASDSSERKTHINAALNNYRSIVARYPFGFDANNWSEKASFEIANIELQRKNPCAAQFHLANIKTKSEDNKWVLKAKKTLRKAKCSAADRQTYNFRNRFDAKKVSVDCRYIIKQEERWNKVCDKIVSYFNSNGAIASKLSGSNAMADADFRIMVSSSGKINTRTSGDHTEYQYEGDINTRITEGSSPFLEDNYSGIGGWNPISEQMAMEVLGIHVYKRLIKTLNKEIEG